MSTQPGRKTFYITTPIYYPNGEPHLGHTYTTICADVIARYHRLAGHDTFLLTGTDEHGVKMVKTAAERGIEPRQLADEMVAVFENLWKEIHITHDNFIRTSSERHRTAVQEIVRRLEANGDLYVGPYEGWYDEGQEEFVSDTDAKARNFLAFNKKPLVRYSEPTYYFRLTKYIPRVLAHIESNPGFIHPESRRNEMISKLKMGVEDLSISRASLKWGIPMPNDPAHVLYVWIDALSNYITALGYGSADDSLFRKYWPADVHLIGKEIMWFHTVYWPAMLFSLGLEPPKQVYAHGWWLADGRKMSKTEGNFIGLPELRAYIATYGLDALRFYMLRAAPFGSDLDFVKAKFHEAFNELGNVLGNCLNRTINMIGKYRDRALPAPSGGINAGLEHDLLDRIEALPNALAAAYDKLELQQCVLLPLELARATNGFIDATRPFSLAKDPAQQERLNTVLYLSAQAVYRALVAMLPVMPEKAAEGLRQLGVAIEGKTFSDLFGTLPVGQKLGEAQPLFPKVDK